MKSKSTSRFLIASAASGALALSAANAATTAAGSGLNSTDDSIEMQGPGVVSQDVALGVATEELPIIAQGVTEFGLSGYLDWTDDTTYATSVSYGYFVNDCWLLGVKLGLSGINSDVNFSGGLFAEYNFKTGTKWVPFIGVGANWKRIDSGAFDSDSIEMSGELGVKYFMRANVAVSASISGTWASDTLPGSNDFGSRVNFGLRYFF